MKVNDGHRLKQHIIIFDHQDDLRSGRDGAMTFKQIFPRPFVQPTVANHDFIDGGHISSEIGYSFLEIGVNRYTECEKINSTGIRDILQLGKDIIHTSVHDRIAIHAILRSDEYALDAESGIEWR